MCIRDRGTCLPELVTSVVAAFKGNTDIAVGNVVGSNITNVLLVMGCLLYTSTVSPTRDDRGPRRPKAAR